MYAYGVVILHAINNECVRFDYDMDFSTQTIAFKLSNHVLRTLKLNLDTLE